MPIMRINRMFPVKTGIVLIGLLFACVPLQRAAEIKRSDLEEIALSLVLDGADIFTIQKMLNQRVPQLLFNLEFDERDVAEITINAPHISLPLLLNDICRIVHCTWSFDPVNRSINIFPLDTKRYAYYPFQETIFPVEFKDKTKLELLAPLALFTKDKPYPIIFDLSMSAIQREPKLEGKLENQSFRHALNWLCANSGGRHAWRVMRNKNGYAMFGFMSRPPLASGA